MRGLRQRVPFVSFELNLRDFKDEGLECLKLLEAIGVGGKFNFAADCRRGLEMRQWLTKTEFENVLRKRDEKCIEVFWAAPPFPRDLIKVSPAI